ncbi:MAG: peroxide stress protein YaaA [Paracoccaceae bacterium]
MLIVVSPAKNLNEARAAGHATTVPKFLDEAEELVCVAQTWSQKDISNVMKVSSKIAELNATRFATWKRDSGAAQSAADLFDGDVYKTLEMATMDGESRAEAAKRLRILSGLYGILRPTDDICAYRLEMGRKIPGHIAGSLYKFWGSKISEALQSDAENIQTNTLLNLASDEYFKSVDQNALKDLKIVSPRFEEDRNGVRKMISFSAKRARGAMARWVIETQAYRAEDLKNFDVGGYQFDDEASSEANPVFLRITD